MGSRDQNAKFWDPLITFEQIMLSTLNLAQYFRLVLRLQISREYNILNAPSVVPHAYMCQIFDGIVSETKLHGRLNIGV